MSFLETKGDEFFDLGRKEVIIISTYAFPDGRWRRDAEHHDYFQRTPKKNLSLGVVTIGHAGNKKAQVNHLIWPFS